MDFHKRINETVLNKANEKGVLREYIEAQTGAYFVVELNEKVMEYRGDAFEKGFLRFENKNIQQQIEDEYNQKIINDEEDKKRINEIASQQTEEINQTKEANIRANKANRQNGVYKANFCDGNVSGKFTGCENWFKAPCSKECMKKNAIFGGPNCREQICGKYADGNATINDIKELEKNKELCYESHIFTEYEISAGYDFKKKKPKGWTLEENRVVILTTRESGKSEEERIIFGVFLVDKVFPKTKKIPARATSYPECRIALTYEEAKQLKYYEYSGPNSAGEIIWRENLLIYQTDLVCARILIDIVELMKKTRTPKEVAYAEAFRDKYLRMLRKNINDIPPKGGALI